MRSQLAGTRKAYLSQLATVSLFIIDDLVMRKIITAAEDLLELMMRRYEQASTLPTSNRPVDDWGNFSETRSPSRRSSIACCITRKG
jgi:DNA replication protein DnaC